MTEEIHRVLIIPVIGAVREEECRLHPNCKYETFRKVVEPFLDGDKLDHKAVLYNGERRDMFVGEAAQDVDNRQILNVRATDILNAHIRLLHPEISWHLPTISGTAVLFPDKRVWF